MQYKKQLLQFVICNRFFVLILHFNAFLLHGSFVDRVTGSGISAEHIL